MTSLVAADLFGDETPELVVGLGNRFEVFRIQGEGELERVAIVRLTPADPSNVVSSPRAAVGDVTGDGLPDLVVSFWQRASSLGSRGGGAWLLRGKPDGTLDRPRQFCGPRVAASSLALLDLDGRGGLDVVVADRGRPYGNINGRVFLYAGGRMPRLLRELRTEVKDVRFVLPAHANDDDLIDLVVVGETTVRYQNEGRGRFEPMGDVQPGILFADVPHGYSGDLDGDGRLEAYVLTNSEGGGTLIVEPSGTRFWGNFGRGDRDALHHAVVAVRDVDGDGRAEALMLQSYGTWGIGFFSAEGATERLVASRAFGGPGPDGQDGALLARADGSVERVTLDSLYHSDTRENSWQLTRTSVCTECDGVDVQAGSVRSASGASEWTVR